MSDMIIAFGIGLLVGLFIGIFAMCFAVAASRYDWEDDDDE